MLFRQFFHLKLMDILERKILPCKKRGREVRLQPKTETLNRTYTLSR